MALFITFEGVEGAGKSTLISRLSGRLSGQGVEVLSTREPGATALGKSIRHLLLHPGTHPITPTTEMLLFAADRAQHVEEEILPALNRGVTVLCDRYIDSTLAYQGYARGLKIPIIEELNRIATTGLLPDLTILLDLPVATGLERARSRNKSATDPTSWNRFEQSELTFHERLRSGYLELAKQHPNRIKVLDAQQSPEQLEAQALVLIKDLPRC